MGCNKNQTGTTDKSLQLSADCPSQDSPHRSVPCRGHYERRLPVISFTAFFSKLSNGFQSIKQLDGKSPAHLYLLTNLGQRGDLLWQMNLLS